MNGVRMDLRTINKLALFDRFRMFGEWFGGGCLMLIHAHCLHVNWMLFAMEWHNQYVIGLCSVAAVDSWWVDADSVT